MQKWPWATHLQGVEVGGGGGGGEGSSLLSPVS